MPGTGTETMSAAEFARRYGGGHGVTYAQTQTIHTGKNAAKLAGIMMPSVAARTPNKVEQAWMDFCRSSRHQNASILYEPFKLRLPSGTFYTPDVVIVELGRHPGDGNDRAVVMTCYEVKDVYEHNDRWKLKFKEAASAHSSWLGFAVAKRVSRNPDEWAVVQWPGIMTN